MLKPYKNYEVDNGRESYAYKNIINKTKFFFSPLSIVLTCCCLALIHLILASLRNKSGKKKKTKSKSEQVNLKEEEITKVHKRNNEEKMLLLSMNDTDYKNINLIDNENMKTCLTKMLNNSISNEKEDLEINSINLDKKILNNFINISSQITTKNSSNYKVNDYNNFKLNPVICVNRDSNTNKIKSNSCHCSRIFSNIDYFSTIAPTYDKFKLIHVLNLLKINNDIPSNRGISLVRTSKRKENNFTTLQKNTKTTFLTKKNSLNDFFSSTHDKLDNLSLKVIYTKKKKNNFTIENAKDEQTNKVNLGVEAIKFYNELNETSGNAHKISSGTKLHSIIKPTLIDSSSQSSSISSLNPNAPEFFPVNRVNKFLNNSSVYSLPHLDSSISSKFFPLSNDKPHLDPSSYLKLFNSFNTFDTLLTTSPQPSACHLPSQSSQIPSSNYSAYSSNNERFLYQMNSKKIDAERNEDNFVQLK